MTIDDYAILLIGVVDKDRGLYRYEERIHQNGTWVLTDTFTGDAGTVKARSAQLHHAIRTGDDPRIARNGFERDNSLP